MPGETGGEVQVAARRMQAQDGVLVERVHLVVAGPGAALPERLEGGHAPGQRRPDDLLEGLVLDLQGRLVDAQPA
jgi:hypothetical protein